MILKNKAYALTAFVGAFVMSAESYEKAQKKKQFNELLLIFKFKTYARLPATSLPMLIT